MKNKPFRSSVDHYPTTDPLPKGVENELIEAAQAGNAAARDRVIAANMRWVIRIAVTLRGPHVDFDDLLQEGAMGLLTALERFDTSRGFGFLTYARHWVNQRIMEYIKTHSRQVRLPFNQQNCHRAIRVEIDRADQQHGYHTTATQAVEQLNLNDQRAAELFEIWSNQMESLDDTIKKDPKSGLVNILSRKVIDTIPDPSVVEPLDQIIADENVQTVNRLLQRFLNEREQYIVRRYWGICPNKKTPCTLQEIGNDLGLTRERVRQIKERALQKIKNKRRKRRPESQAVSG